MQMLTWHIGEPVSVGAGQGPVYKLLGNWRPVDVWVGCRTAPSLRNVVVDINVNGASLFKTRPTITAKQTDGTGIFLDATPKLRDGDEITLDIDDTDNPIGGLTVILYIEE